MTVIFPVPTRLPQSKLSDGTRSANSDHERGDLEFSFFFFFPEAEYSPRGRGSVFVLSGGAKANWASQGFCLACKFRVQLSSPTATLELIAL
jgi:hypothetical protein